MPFDIVCIWIGILFIAVSLLHAEPINVPILSNGTKELLLDVGDNGGVHNTYVNGTKLASYSLAESGGIESLSYSAKDCKSGFYGPSFTASIIGVEITEPSYDFGTMNTNASSAATSPLTVTNTGDGEENYKIKATDTDQWTLSNSVDINNFVLQAAFHATIPGNLPATWESQGYNNILMTTDQSCMTNFSINGTQMGIYVEVGDPLSLWLRIKTPLVTSTGTQQNSTLSITAEATDE